jgi:hypothetical protein
VKAAVALVAAVTVIGLTTNAAADSTGSDTADLDITVATSTNVDINPTQLTYGGGGGLAPRDFKASDNNNFAGIQVENSGSNNITGMSIRTTQPNSDPFGTGFAGEYDAGNFFNLRPQNNTGFAIGPDIGSDSSVGGTTSDDSIGGNVNTDETAYHYPARVDFNASGPTQNTGSEPAALTYVEVPGPEFRYGRFRAGDEEFFWAIETGSSDEDDGNVCDGGSSGETELKVGNKPHTDDAIGTVDFTDSNEANYANYSVSTEDNSGDFGITDGVELNTTHGNTTYSVLSWCAGGTSLDTSNAGAASDKTFLVRTKYDLQPFEDAADDFPDTAGPITPPSDGGGVQKLINTDETASGNPMHPGNSFTLFTGVEIPRGVASGSVGPGTLTVTASSPDA